MNISLRVLAGIAVVGAAAAVGADASSSSSSTSLRASRAGCTPWSKLSLQINNPDKILTECTAVKTDTPRITPPFRTTETSLCNTDTSLCNTETTDTTSTPPPTPNRCMSFVLEQKVK